MFLKVCLAIDFKIFLDNTCGFVDLKSIDYRKTMTLYFSKKKKVQDDSYDDDLAEKKTKCGI